VVAPVGARDDDAGGAQGSNGVAKASREQMKSADVVVCCRGELEVVSGKRTAYDAPTAAREALDAARAVRHECDCAEAGGAACGVEGCPSQGGALVVAPPDAPPPSLWTHDRRGECISYVVQGVVIDDKARALVSALSADPRVERVKFAAVTSSNRVFFAQSSRLVDPGTHFWYDDSAAESPSTTLGEWVPEESPLVRLFVIATETLDSLALNDALKEATVPNGFEYALDDELDFGNTTLVNKGARSKLRTTTLPSQHRVVVFRRSTGELAATEAKCANKHTYHTRRLCPKSR
jgi:hypothetical protein